MSPSKNPLELVDRYLNAVRFWLPKTQREEDVLAELGDDLRSQIEAKESELGRPITKEEVSEILKRCGMPMIVAGRLAPKRYLIGPTLFPIYAFVLKMVLLWIIVPVFSLHRGTGNTGHASGRPWNSDRHDHRQSVVSVVYRSGNHNPCVCCDRTNGCDREG